MAFEKIQTLECEVAVTLGGRDKKTSKANPTSVEGYYLGNRDIPDKFSKTGTNKLYVLQTDKGNIGVYGKTHLNRQMTSVVPGTMIRITQEGSVPTNKGNNMLTYIVEVDKENTIEVGSFGGVSAAAESDDYDSGDVHSDDQEESPEPVAPPARVPTRAAVAPSADSQARMQALLNGRKSK